MEASGHHFGSAIVGIHGPLGDSDGIAVHGRPAIPLRQGGILFPEDITATDATRFPDIDFIGDVVVVRIQGLVQSPMAIPLADGFRHGFVVLNKIKVPKHVVRVRLQDFAGFLDVFSGTLRRGCLVCQRRSIAW